MYIFRKPLPHWQFQRNPFSPFVKDHLQLNVFFCFFFCSLFYSSLAFYNVVVVWCCRRKTWIGSVKAYFELYTMFRMFTLSIHYAMDGKQKYVWQLEKNGEEVKREAEKHITSKWVKKKPFPFWIGWDDIWKKATFFSHSAYEHDCVRVNISYEKPFFLYLLHLQLPSLLLYTFKMAMQLWNGNVDCCSFWII